MKLGVEHVLVLGQQLDAFLHDEVDDAAAALRAVARRRIVQHFDLLEVIGGKLLQKYRECLA